MYDSKIAIPFSASWINLSSGAHDAVIVALHGFMRCMPFWHVDPVESSMTCGGIIFEADRNWMTLLNKVLVVVQCVNSN